MIQSLSGGPERLLRLHPVTDRRDHHGCWTGGVWGVGFLEEIVFSSRHLGEYKPPSSSSVPIYYSDSGGGGALLTPTS
jgi:hypothetical protein